MTHSIDRSVDYIDISIYYRERGEGRERLSMNESIKSGNIPKFWHIAQVKCARILSDDDVQNWTG